VIRAIVSTTVVAGLSAGLLIGAQTPALACTDCVLNVQEGESVEMDIFTPPPVEQEPDPVTGETPPPVAQPPLQYPRYQTRTVVRYSPLSYGTNKDQYVAGYPSSDGTVSGYRANVGAGDWSIRDTPIGAKAHTVGVTFKIVGTRPPRIVYSDALGKYKVEWSDPWTWSTPTLDWDNNSIRLTPRSAGSNMTTMWNWRGDIGVGFCAQRMRGHRAGPLNPAPSYDSAPIVVGAVLGNGGRELTADEFRQRDDWRESPWGIHRGDDGTFSQGAFLRDCYPQGTSVSFPSAQYNYTNGRYANSVEGEGDAARVFTFSGDTEKLARAHVPSGGTYVYRLNPPSRSQSLTSATAGQAFSYADLTPVNAAATRLIALSCHGYSERTFEFSEAGYIADRWAQYAWPDGGRSTYYLANACPTPNDVIPPTIPGTRSDAGARGNTGIAPQCLDAYQYPEIEAFTASGLTRSTMDTTVEVLANNNIAALDFHGDDVRVYIRDGAGEGFAADRSRTPIERSVRYYLGGVNRTVPDTVSPSWVGTFNPNGALVGDEVNEAAGQPYATVPWDRIAEQRANRTQGVWQNLERWNSRGSADFLPGLGIAFDEPSTPGRTFVLQAQWRERGVFRVAGSAIGVGGSSGTWSGGAPVAGALTTTPGPVPQWATETFECTSRPASISARDVRIGPGF